MDALREGRRTWAEQLSGTVPAVAHRLLQLQLVVIYVSSGWSKAQGGAWWEGRALYEAVSVGGYQRWPAASEWVLGSPLGQWIMMLGTWLTLFWELGFGLLVLWRPTRIAALVIGVIVHAGIFAGMMVGAFSAIMIWMYQAWLPPDWPLRLRDWWNERQHSKHG